jgi:PIN domain nuclease of toxin-antitoxin system
MLTAIADTHALIWYLFGDKQLSATVGAFFTATAAAGDQIGISAITPIEIVYLIEKGQIPADTFVRLRRALVQPPALLIEIPLEVRISEVLQQLPAPKFRTCRIALSLRRPIILVCRCSHAIRRFEDRLFRRSGR